MRLESDRPADVLEDLQSKDERLRRDAAES